MSTTERKANRLAREKSPYLLQHAHNPVDWYPWGEEAFELARREDRPIFLSIGYSTCHWCHVMERESFENDAVAERLNRWYVPVKLDREERPDVDHLYMTAMQALGLGGGWPLNVFLTPAREPFYGGTYFPPDARHGRPGLIDVLQRVHEVWTTERGAIAAQGARLIAALREAVNERPAGSAAAAGGAASWVEDACERCLGALERLHDAEAGGFGAAPKFPTPANLDFLAHEAWRTPAHRGRAAAMLYRQLDAMRAGGIHDHLGGGFHRYATDRAWMVPHFEKMLYDQAQLAWAYLEGVRLAELPGVTHDAARAADYRAVARGVFDYVARDLSALEGGFYSAEDADSEGEEGRFYVWTHGEIDAALGADAELFAFCHGVTPEGNFEHGTSILHWARDDGEAAERFAISETEVRARLARAARTLLERRERRPRPHRDDKVLTTWNGLMISAFARGARVLGDPGLAERGARAAEFVWSAVRDPGDGALRRRWRDGEAAGAGQLADHANLALGCLDLFGATGEALWLERGMEVAERMFERFADREHGGLFDGPADPNVPVRMKDDYDGAELAGASVAARVAVTLAAWTEPSPWRARADALLEAMRPRLVSQPLAMPAFLVAAMQAAAPRHLVVAGDPAAADTRALRDAIERLVPADEIVLPATGGAAQERLAARVPAVAAIAPRAGRAAAYVCLGASCGLPITDPELLAGRLAPAGS